MSSIPQNVIDGLAAARDRRNSNTSPAADEAVRRADALVEDMRRENAELRARTEAAELASATTVRVVETEAAQLRSRVFARDLDALVAEGRNAGKIAACYVPAFKKLANAMGLDFAREQLASMPVVIPQTIHQPATLDTTRRWEDIPWQEKSRLQEEDPALCLQLLAEHRRRTGGRGVK